MVLVWSEPKVWVGGVNRYLTPQECNAMPLSERLQLRLLFRLHQRRGRTALDWFNGEQTAVLTAMKTSGLIRILQGVVSLTRQGRAKAVAFEADRLAHQSSAAAARRRHTLLLRRRTRRRKAKR